MMRKNIMNEESMFYSRQMKKVVPHKRETTQVQKFASRLQSVLPRQKKISLMERRSSTVSNLKHDMWVLRLDEAIDRYLKVPRKHECVEVYQDLQRQGALTNWKLVEKDATIIFLSHEWVGWNHPDPSGIQIRCALRTLQRLRDGEIEEVIVDVKHSLFYKYKFKKTKAEWVQELKNAYIWFDWISMPQPMASQGLSEHDKAMLETNGRNAVMSISAYVERCDFLLIVAPACAHADRIDKVTNKKARTCFRSWRKRGWCVLEFFSAALSRDKAAPVLLVRSAEATPYWLAPNDMLFMSAGLADFTCCQLNHVIRGNNVKCDRPIVRGIIETLITGKIKEYRKLNMNVAARAHVAYTPILLRGLPKAEKEENNGSSSSDESEEDSNDEDSELCKGSAVDKLKHKLFWKEKRSESYFRRMVPFLKTFDDDMINEESGMSLLMYAVMMNDTDAVELLVKQIHAIPNKSRRRRILDCRASKKVQSAYLFIPDGYSVLHIAMGYASPCIVRLLLDNGANPNVVEGIGQDPFVSACGATGQLANMKLWMERFPDHDIHKPNKVSGGFSLSTTVFCMPNKLENLEFLLKCGGNVDQKLHMGISVLQAAISNSDSDVRVVKCILEASKERSAINYRIKPRNFKWKLIIRLANRLYRMGVRGNAFVEYFAPFEGATALHIALKSGDLDVVEYLLKNGANPRIRDGIGRSAFDYLEIYGPYPAITGLMDFASKTCGIDEKL